MLQPCSEMSDMSMGPMGRGLSTRRRTGETMTTNARRRDADDEFVKEDRSFRGIALKVIRLVVPHIALLAVFFLYLAIGAYIFIKLEGPTNDAAEYRNDIAHMKNELYSMFANASTKPTAIAGATRLPPGDAQAPVTSISTPTRARPNENAIGSVGEDDGEAVTKEDIDRLVDEMVVRMSRPEWKIARMESMQVGRAWSFPSALLFSMTTITTIGYGDIVPVTAWGRAICIIYSIIGIPLALLFLADIGNILARLTLLVCRHAHSRMSLQKRLSACCGSCCCRRAKVNSPRTSSQRNIIDGGGDFEIAMNDVHTKQPAYHSEPHDVKQDKSGLPPSFLRSVSIATEKPTSYPGGVTSQPSTLSTAAESDACAQPAKQCQCTHQCDCAQKEADFLDEVPLVVVVCILVAYICGGAAMMMSSEGWDYGTAFYFMFITLTTIGFGDVLPTNHYARGSFLPCLFFTVFGLAIMSMCIALVQIKILRAFAFMKTKLGLC